ncbi:MAG: arsenate reductase (glutaredoxin) [Chitinophagaceae bacterium]|nr:arsenate reductase (glutaredoxin) [Chitinophagaceae bacterium]MCW5906002.1 arsenate reductase (glutaredoxin) [Chitinophagaceae bacterium]
MKTIIYHNPQCSKSREGLCVLEEIGEDVVIKNYLIEPPTYKELENLLKLLKVKPLDIIRKKEPIFKEKYEGKKLTKKQWIEAMIQDPILIERPIVVRGDKAVIGRPPTLIKDLIK